MASSSHVIDHLENHRPYWKPKRRMMAIRQLTKLKISPGMPKSITIRGGDMRDANGCTVPRLDLVSGETSLVFDMTNLGMKIEERIMWPRSSPEYGRNDRNIANLSPETYQLRSFTEELSSGLWTIVLKVKRNLNQGILRMEWDSRFGPPMSQIRQDFGRQMLATHVIRSVDGMSITLTIDASNIQRAKFNPRNILFALLGPDASTHNYLDLESDG